MADKQITPFQLTDQFTMDNFNQRINETNIALQKMVNPNLLDNWYFGNPVNQRGGYVVPPGTTFYGDSSLSNPLGATPSGLYQTVISKTSTYAHYKGTDGVDYYCAASDAVRGYTGAGCGIDRWKSNGASVLISSDGVTITGDSVGFRQILNDYKLLSRKTVTLSFLAKEINGLLVMSLISGSFRQDFAQDGLFISQTIALPELTAPLECWVYHNGEGTSTLKAAKLELGSQQTLAHQDADGNWVLNEIPDYGEQLARCQRYRVEYGRYAQWGVVDIQPDYIDFSIYLPVTMRAFPSIEGASNLSVNGYSGFAFQVAAFNGNNLRIRATKSNHGFTRAYLEASNKIAFVAEL